VTGCWRSARCGSVWTVAGVAGCWQQRTRPPKAESAIEPRQPNRVHVSSAAIAELDTGRVQPPRLLRWLQALKLSQCLYHTSYTAAHRSQYRFHTECKSWRYLARSVWCAKWSPDKVTRVTPGTLFRFVSSRCWKVLQAGRSNDLSGQEDQAEGSRKAACVGNKKDNQGRRRLSALVLRQFASKGHPTSLR